MNKEIIEIIEPYMDKTLSEGCWFKRKTDDYDKIVSEYIEWDFQTTKWFLDEQVNKWDYKILWHYDITAVEKYILEQEWWFISMWDWKNKAILSWWMYKWLILMKPLYLYTEQENNSLFKLLKQLWNTNT